MIASHCSLSQGRFASSHALRAALFARRATAAVVAVMLVALLSPVATAQAQLAAGIDTAVVCPAVFRPALEPWVQLRQQQGHKLAFVAADGTAADIQTRIRALAGQQAGLKFVLLIGDVPPRLGGQVAATAATVPTFHTPAKVIKLLGRDEEIAGDNRYGDLDGDGVADLAIGRLSVETPEQLKTVVAKILAHEQRAFCGPTRRRIHFVAGLGGFGALADKVLELCAQRFICDGVPVEYDTSMTYASWASPYCPPLEMFCHTALARMNEGSLFWVYIGHGHPRGLDWIRLPDNRYQSIMSCDDASRLQCQQGAPVALFLACYTGAFDLPEKCLAEELLHSPGGPVAVFSGSRVTMPYAMTVLGQELLKECFVNQRATIGEIMLHAKRNLVLGQREGTTARLLDSLAATLGFHSDLDAERREHLELFNLLGDPLLRVPRPGAMELTAPATAAGGTVIDISGTCSLDGPCTVEVVVPRDKLTFNPGAKSAPSGSPAQRENYGKLYDRANDRRLVSIQTECRQGRFTARLPLPEGYVGKCHVIGYLQGQGEAALGTSELELTAPK